MEEGEVVLKLKCSCPSCKARLNAQFKKIANGVFTKAEIDGIADRVLAEFTVQQVNQFLK